MEYLENVKENKDSKYDLDNLSSSNSVIKKHRYS